MEPREDRPPVQVLYVIHETLDKFIQGTGTNVNAFASAMSQNLNWRKSPITIYSI